MLDGFSSERIPTGDGALFLRRGGEGPPLVLLHGFPQTHLCWYRVAPELARHFTVILPDLPGYGESRVTTPGDEPFSKRGMARQIVEGLRTLGIDRFALVGHDRGGRAAYRLALDHPAAVSRLALLDIIPTLETWETADKAFGFDVWHWFFLALRNGLPEAAIAAAPDLFLDKLVAAWAASPLDPLAMEAYRIAFRRPEVIAAACADYRMGATLDSDHDAADRAAGRRIACPLLALWGQDGDDMLAKGGRDDGRDDPLRVWRRWAGEVSGRGLPAGHFLAEELPDAVLAELLPFLRDAGR